MALLVSGIECEVHEVKLSHKPPAMIDASPKATVPVLVLPDGQVIDQSLDIMHWALRVHDPELWMLPDARSLITENDGPFKHHLDRYKYPTRFGVDPLLHRAAGLTILHTLETRLADKPNLCRSERSLADIAVMPFVRQFAATDKVWFGLQLLPKLHGWLEQHQTSALFEKAMAQMPKECSDNA